MMRSSPTLDYRAPALSSANDNARFQLIYAAGIAVAYAVVWFCFSSWPHTSNAADPRKAELAMTIQIAGGAACAWLALAMYRISRSKSLRRSLWTWLLVAANALVALAVLPSSDQ